MKLLEQYEEVIERDSSEVSYAWKAILVSAYLLSSIASYACSFMFYRFWNDVCGGHCFFWAEIDLESKDSINSPNISYMTFEVQKSDGWTKDVLVIYQFHHHCEKFHFFTLLSCMVAVTLLIMFSICGKGGHDTNLFVAPWRMVVPALICSFIMAIITLYQAHAFTHGYFHFSEGLYQLAHGVVKNKRNPFKYSHICQAFETFTRIYNIYHYDSCGLFTTIEISIWAMIWGWIGSFFILCLRILMSADFNLLKVQIYEIPKDESVRKSILKKVQEGKLFIESEKEKKTVRIKEKQV